jgi:hypothetical protein
MFVKRAGADFTGDDFTTKLKETDSASTRLQSSSFLFLSKSPRAKNGTHDERN